MPFNDLALLLSHQLSKNHPKVPPYLSIQPPLSTLGNDPT